MQNMLQLQDDLKNFSEQQLVREMQMPSGQVPQFLILTELGRRKRIRDDFSRQQAAGAPTVAEEAVAAAGMPVGASTDMAKAMAPKTSMTENTGIGAMMPKQPTRMAEGGDVKPRNRFEMLMAYLRSLREKEEEPTPTSTGPSIAEMINFGGDYEPVKKAEGGVVKMRTGGLMSAVANLKVNYPELYEEYKDDPNALAYIAKTMAESAKDPEQTALEQMEAPRSFDTLQRMLTDPTNRAVTEKQSEIEAGQADRAIQAQIDTANRLRGTTEDDPLFTEGTPVDFLPENQVYKLPRTTSVTSVEGSLSAPEAPVISLPSVTAESPIKTQSGTIPFVPSSTDSATIQGSPTTDFSIEPGSPAETDAIREYLRGDRDGGYGVVDYPDINPADTKFTQTVIDDALGARDGAFFNEEKRPYQTLVNRRAQEYLQSDMYTPPEEIYDLGPLSGLKYTQDDDKMTQAEKDAEFLETSQRLFLERQAADAAADARIPEGPNMETELRDARVADLIGGKMSADNTFPVPDSLGKTAVDIAADAVEKIGGVVNTAAETGADMAIGRTASRSNEVVLGEGAEFIDPATTQKAQMEAEKAALENLLNPKPDNKGGGSGSKSGAGGGLDGQLADMLKDMEKSREQDKWMALAKMGMALMSSKQPTLGGALGEAGMEGMKDLQDSKKSYNKDKMTILALQQRIDASKRAAASKSTGLSASQSLTRGLAILKQGQDMMENAKYNEDPMLAERAQQLINYGNALMGIPNIGSTGTGAIKAPSAS